MQMQPTSNIDSVQVTRQRSLWSWARSCTYGACYHTYTRVYALRRLRCKRACL